MFRSVNPQRLAELVVPKGSAENKHGPEGSLVTYGISLKYVAFTATSHNIR
jgi:hypothetical protein